MHESMHYKLCHLCLNAFHRKLRENLAGYRNIADVWPAATWHLRATVEQQIVLGKGKGVYEYGL